MVNPLADAPSTFILYGESGSGKSAQVREIAEWEFKRTGLLTRALIADSTVDPYRDLLISEENPNGIIQAFNLKGMRDPWNRFELMAQGFTPRATARKEGGFNIVMDPPVIKDGRMVLWYPGSDGKAILTEKRIGQIVNEGLTTFSDVLLQDHADHAESRQMWGSGKEGVTMFETESLVQMTPGGAPQVQKTKIGRAVGGHYGSVQRWMLSTLIPRFSELRYVDRVVWTAHTARGKDEFTGMEGKALGPATVGQATVDKTTKLFGHAFHFEIETFFDKDKNVQRNFKAWFVDHPDSVFTSPQLNWPAKISMTIAQSQEVLKRFPKGYIPLTNGSMGQFLEILHPLKSSGEKA